MIVALIIRIARSDESLFSVDFAYTFFLSFATSSLVFQFVVYLSKFSHNYSAMIMSEF